MEEYNQFISNYRTKRFKRGELVLVQGEVPECVYVVKSGIIKSYNLTTAGEEKPIGFDRATEIFPLGWSSGKQSNSQFYYEAMVETEVYCIPRKDLWNLLENNPKVMALAFERLMSRFLTAQMRINALEQSKASQKVLNIIHFLCLRFGDEVKNDVVQIDLPLTQQDLANLIGLTRETTGIELKKLQESGVIRRKKLGYVVRTDKLNSLLDEDYTLGSVGDQIP